MTKLVITRGLPGSGKSTWARQWVSEDPKHRAEVNRDLLRAMMHGGYADAEVQVTVARDAAIRDLLKQGVDVVCSDTNLPQRTVRDLLKIAHRAGAAFEVHDMTNVGIDLCVYRNAKRTDKDPVPVSVIKDMYERYIKGKGYPLPMPVQEDGQVTDPDFVERVPGLPRAVLVDIDGTVALKGARSPFDESRVHEDRPNQRVIDVVHALYLSGETIIFMSGRTEDCKAATEEWLNEHVGVAYAGLYMRRDRGIKDSIVKRQLFDKYIRGNYNVTAVLDDRDQVVRMWREELGLTCLQVAEGNF